MAGVETNSWDKDDGGRSLVDVPHFFFYKWMSTVAGEASLVCHFLVFYAE